jgi:hypothetical protein
VDPVTGQIRTLRLILKRGLVPQWASKWLPVSSASGGRARGLDAWVLEESVVDPPGWGLGADDAEAAGAAAGAPAEATASVVPPGSSEEYRAQPRLRCRQGNLSFKKFMHVIEGGELCAGPNG